MIKKTLICIIALLLIGLVGCGRQGLINTKDEAQDYLKNFEEVHYELPSFVMSGTEITPEMVCQPVVYEDENVPVIDSSQTMFGYFRSLDLTKYEETDITATEKDNVVSALLIKNGSKCRISYGVDMTEDIPEAGSAVLTFTMEKGGIYSLVVPDMDADMGNVLMAINYASQGRTQARVDIGGNVIIYDNEENIHHTSAWSAAIIQSILNNSVLYGEKENTKSAVWDCSAEISDGKKYNIDSQNLLIQPSESTEIYKIGNMEDETGREYLNIFMNAIGADVPLFGA